MDWAQVPGTLSYTDPGPAQTGQGTNAVTGTNAATGQGEAAGHGPAKAETSHPGSRKREATGRSRTCPRHPCRERLASLRGRGRGIWTIAVVLSLGRLGQRGAWLVLPRLPDPAGEAGTPRGGPHLSETDPNTRCCFVCLKANNSDGDKKKNEATIAR